MVWDMAGLSRRFSFSPLGATSFKLIFLALCHSRRHRAKLLLFITGIITYSFSTLNVTPTRKSPWIFVMQFLVATITLALASFLPTAAAAPPATPCVPDSKVLGTLAKNFTLRVLVQDDRGRVDLKVSKPVIFGSYETVSGATSDALIVGSAGAQAEVFELKNNRLLNSSPYFTYNLGLENPDYEPNPNGPRSIVRAGSLGAKAYDFTAVQACDRYGRGFLRLGQNRSEFITT